MKKFISIFAFVFLLMSNVVSAAYFTDVDDDNIYAESINWLAENGVVWGYSDGSYGPYNYVSRVEFLKMLYEAVGLTGVGEGDVLSFSDINEDAWYIKYLEEAYATGVVDGYPDGTFRPDDQINFAEAMKIVANAFFDVDGLYGDGSDYDYCLQDFSDDSDVDTSEWYWSYVYVVDELCIISDFNSVHSSSGFHPQYSVSRGDMADLLYRAKSVVDESDESPFYLKYEDGMEPDSSLSYNEFSFFELDVGDEVGDLTVAGINLFYTDMDLSPYNFYATFDGELTLTGTLYKLDAFDIPFYYLTDLADDSLFKIPALATLDKGSDAFLYFDEDEVDTSLDYENGVGVTLTVDSLKIVGYVETTAWDTADIVSIDEVFDVEMEEEETETAKSDYQEHDELSSYYTFVEYNSSILDDEVIKGSSSAPVTIIEWADFNCMYCQVFYEDTYPVISDYIDDGDVQYVFKNYPLYLGSNSHDLAQLLECTGSLDSDSYFDLHDYIFENISSMTDQIQETIDYAVSLGVDETNLTDCYYDADKYYEVEADYAEGFQLGITGTPGFVINGYLVPGAISSDDLEYLVDFLLAN